MTTNNIRSWLTGTGSVVLGCATVLATLLLGGLFVYGGARLAAVVYPWLGAAAGFVFVLVVPILLVLALFRRTRSFAGSGLYVCSFLFGAVIWIWSLLLSYNIWGPFAVIIGLFLVGIGIVPVAILATLINGMWAESSQLLLGVILVFLVRFVGIALAGGRSGPNQASRLEQAGRHNDESGFRLPEVVTSLPVGFPRHIEPNNAPNGTEAEELDNTIRVFDHDHRFWEDVSVEWRSRNLVRLTCNPTALAENDDPLHWGDTLEVAKLREGEYRLINIVERGAYRHFIIAVHDDFTHSTAFRSFSDVVRSAGGEWKRISGRSMYVHFPTNSGLDPAALIRELYAAMAAS